MNLLLVHGPNLNLLGERKPEVYGTTTLLDIEADVAAAAGARGAAVLSFQSNHEGAIIDFLHEHRKLANGVVINAGAYTHTSVALHDAIEAIRDPGGRSSHLEHARPGRLSSPVNDRSGMSWAGDRARARRLHGRDEPLAGPPGSIEVNSRLDRIRAALDEANLDALMISAPGEENMGMESRYYTAGFTGSAGVVLITRDQAVIAADFRYTEQAEAECRPHGYRVFPAFGGSRQWFGKFVGETGIAGKRVGLSTHDLTYAARRSLTRLASSLPTSDRPKWLPAPDILGKLRKTKDSDELRLLQAAIDISDRAFEQLETALVPETSELIAAEMFAANVKAEGGTSISFDTIVAGGPNGAMPHAKPTPAAVGADRPIVIDMGAKFGGYCSDLTRTIVLGKHDAKVLGDLRDCVRGPAGGNRGRRDRDECTVRPMISPGM